MQQIDAKLSCYINPSLEDDRILLYVSLIDEKASSIILQFADITKEIEDFMYINEQYEIYPSLEELIEDVEKAHLQRFVNRPQSNQRLDLIMNIRMKIRHNEGVCGNDCILCNPDIGDDPFPDFTFDIVNLDSEDEV